MSQKKLATLTTRKATTGDFPKLVPATAEPTTKFKAKPGADGSELGVLGFSITGGYLVSPERNPALVGTRRYKTFSEILANTSIVASGTRYFLNLVSKPAWKAIPVNDSDEAKTYADKLIHVLEDTDIPWHRVVRRAAMYKFYGFGIQEWTTKLNKNGVIGFKSIAARPQVTIERWDCDEKGRVKGVWQRDPNNAREIYIPRAKMMYAVDDSLNDTPEGLGLYRHLVGPSRLLTRYEELEGWGYETDLRGIPVGRAPIAELRAAVDQGSITDIQMKQALEPLRSFIENHIKGPKLGIMLDSQPYQSGSEALGPTQIKQWEVDLLKAQANSQEDIDRAINRINHEMARVLGVEHIMIGSQGKGSLSMSRDKTNNFYSLVDGSLKELVEVAEMDLVNPLWELNGWPEEMKPQLQTDAIKFRDVEEVTSAIRDMANAGALLAPNDPAINEMRDLLGLSHAPELDDEMMALLYGPPPGSEEGGGGTPKKPKPKPAGQRDPALPKPAGGSKR